MQQDVLCRRTSSIHARLLTVVAAVAVGLLANAVSPSVARAVCARATAIDEATPAQTASGAAVTWTIRTLFAGSDVPILGTAARVLWVGTNNKPYYDTWVEVGEAKGWDGSNIHVFYTAEATDFTTNPHAPYSEMSFGPSPVVGDVHRFYVIGWGTYSMLAMIDGIYTWESGNATYPHTPPVPSYAAGLETTCGDEARIDRTYDRELQYLVRDDFGSTYYDTTNGSFRGEGTTVGKGIDWCSPYTAFKYYLHSQIDTTPCE